jgi:signal transduction histidine kinase
MPIGFQIGKDMLSNETINGKPIIPSESPLSKALKTGKPAIGQEYLYQRKGSKPRTLRVSSAAIHNKRKKVIAAATIVQDISRQKELERQKDEFLGIASHELKTPVTSIKAYGQALQASFRKKGDSKSVEQLGKMDTQINKLTNLIEDLLDVTKIQSGRLEFRESHFDFNPLVDEVVAEMQLTTQ